nr:MAG TPA: minor tail protein [Caudoviricetes sp.]
MASRKEYEMLFQLNAQLGGSYSKTFKAAQDELAAMQKEIQSLSKTQSDITAYQKQQTAVENTRKRLELLQQQYDNIQKEIQQTGEFSADLQNKLLAKQQQIDKTTSSLNRQTERLDEMGDALKEAGVDMDDLGQSSARLTNRIDALKKEQEEVAEGAQTFGNKASQAFGAVHEAIVAAGIATALKEVYEYFADCAQASMDFESAMTGVAKTTDLTDDELSAMSDAIKETSTEIPATTEELAAIAESAGQMGIHKESLLDFTEIMAMLGTSTNMTADEAATSLSRLANITGMSQEDFDRLGATIVDLGNNLATTEKEIVDMSLRIAGAGAQVNMTEAEIMSFSGALSSVGIEAEAGGSAFSTLISNMSLAVQQGGDGLEQFADVAGMSASEFAAAFEDDAAGAIIQFIRGLGNMESEGRSAIAVLDDMGLSDIRMRDALLRAAGASDVFTNALQIGSNAWDENTALVNEASKRYATTQSQLTMMQNAYKNLKVAIGDAYTPALQKAYSVGTQVLNAVSQFIKQNPALVNAITAFVGVLGLVVAALAAYTVGAKVAAAASAMLTAAIPGVNIIMGVAAAVAGVTAAIAALATAAANDAVPSVDELTQAAQGMREAMDEANATYDDTVSSTLAAAGVADTYIAKLEEMEAAGVRTEEEHRQYHNTLALLCQVVPDLANYIDLETDTIEGGTAALRANTEAWKQNAMQQAYQEQLTALYSQYSAVLIEAEENSIGLTKAQYDLEAAEKKQTDTFNRMNELMEEANAEAQAYSEEYGVWADATTFLTQEYYDLQDSIYDINDEIWTAQDTIDAYTKAIEEDQEAVAAAEEEIALAEEAVQNLTAATQDGGDAATEAAAQEQELQTAITGVKEEINALVTAYTEAYDAALESISGQYQLWDEAAGVVATSAGTINSALESQITYWQDYNANLQTLTERSADIEGLSEMIASFADGSEESVNAIAGMAGATDEQLATMVANWQTLQTEQEAAAGSVADLKTDFTATMDELQAELAADIEAMDLGAEAAASGRATIQGFVSGAEGMLPQVQAAYSRIAQAAIDAIDAKLEIHSPSRVMEEKADMTWAGYIKETEALQPDVAEAMSGMAGAGVEAFSAEEIQAVGIAPQLMAYLASYQAGNAISAESGAGGGGGSIVIYFEPQYDLAGVTNAAELEAILAAHDEDMRELILEVLQEAGVDAARRAYT